MSAPNFRLRSALPDDAASLTRIAHEAKRHWGYPERWIEHWQADLTITPEYLSRHQTIIAESEGQVVGFYALVAGEGKAELDHLWVTPECIGKGVGKALFIHAMQDAASRKISEVQISSDPNAEGFYTKMGAYKIGESISEIDGQTRSLPVMNAKPAS